MPIDWGLIAAIAMPVITLVLGVFLDRAVERRSKLITYYGHVSVFAIKSQEGDILVHTHSVVIRNAGRLPAKNVKLGHHYLPDFRLNPSVECSVQPLPSGGDEIVLPELVPGEQVTVSYLYPAPITWNMINSYVKSDEGMAQVISVLLSRRYPRWVQRVAAILLLLGVISSIYIIAFVVSAFI